LSCGSEGEGENYQSKNNQYVAFHILPPRIKEKEKEGLKPSPFLK
jgi:hypothetical protein